MLMKILRIFQGKNYKYYLKVFHCGDMRYKRLFHQQTSSSCMEYMTRYKPFRSIFHPIEVHFKTLMFNLDEISITLFYIIYLTYDVRGLIIIIIVLTIVTLLQRNNTVMTFHVHVLFMNCSKIQKIINQSKALSPFRNVTNCYHR